MLQIIEWRTKPGDLILDPYGGSGPVLLACETTGRICHTADIVPAYCDVILRRWSELANESPVRESDGALWYDLRHDDDR